MAVGRWEMGTPQGPGQGGDRARTMGDLVGPCKDVGGHLMTGAIGQV